MNDINRLSCRWHEPKFQKRVENVVSAGRAIFAGTAITGNIEAGIKDYSVVKMFFDLCEPDRVIHPELSNWRGIGSFTEHSDLASIVAFEIANAVNHSLGENLKPHDNSIALHLHDLGRTTTHAFMETDVMTDHLWSMINIRPELHSLTHSAHLYWDDDEIPPEKLTLDERISIISDTAAKRSKQSQNRLRLTSEIIPAVQEGKKKYLNKKNPSFYEQQMVHKLPEYTRREINTISHTLLWFSSIGINLDEIIQSIPLESAN